MQFLLRLALVFHILANHRFAATFAYRAREIAIGPKLTAPWLFLGLRATTENFARRETLHHHHDFDTPNVGTDCTRRLMWSLSDPMSTNC